MNQELTNSDLVFQDFILCGFFSKMVRLNTFFLKISIIASQLFLIAQSKLKYPFFTKPQKIIGTNRKI